MAVSAPVVGVSRVIAGAHFLHDVALGALIAGVGLLAHVGGEAWMWNPTPYVQPTYWTLGTCAIGAVARFLTTCDLVLLLP